MPLTAAQLAILKADIAGDPALAQTPHTPDGAVAVAAAYAAFPQVDYWVWRTGVSEAEYVGTPGVDVANGNAATNWSWTAYIARSVGEQNGWSRMFAGGSVNPSLANIRQGVADIFSGNTNNAPAQRNHLMVLSKRRANRAEKLFAAGAGTFASPSLMGFEGVPSPDDVVSAWNG